MVHVPDAKRFFRKTVTAEIDRTIGSRHSGFIYPVEYGFLPHTKGPDNNEVSHFQRGDYYAA